VWPRGSGRRTCEGPREPAAARRARPPERSLPSSRRAASVACTHAHGEEVVVAERADVVVVGMGPGGEEVASRLAEAGLDVVGIEAELVGGECPYWGCVPSKMIVRAADLLAESRRVGGMAGTADVRADWAPVATRIRSEATDSWDDTVAVERFERTGGRLVRGRATLDGPGTVRVGETELHAARGVVVATGRTRRHRARLTRRWCRCARPAPPPPAPRRAARRPRAPRRRRGGRVPRRPSRAPRTARTPGRARRRSRHRR